MASMTTSARCRLSARGCVSTDVFALALIVWVAPKSLAHASFWSSMSTAMIVAAPASSAPTIAAFPTPPQPMTATESPRPTSPVLMAAPMTGHHSTTEQAGSCGLAAGSTLVHWPAATSVFSAKAPMPRAGLSSVPSASVIFWVALWVAKAVLRLAAIAVPAVATHRTPVQDHIVAGCDLGDVVADRLDDARRLVAEQERELVVDAALAVVQIGVADTAGLDLDQRLARARDRER